MRSGSRIVWYQNGNVESADLALLLFHAGRKPSAWKARKSYGSKTLSPENRMILGIDPGMTGAIALVNPDPLELVSVADMPTIAGKVDAHQLAVEIRRLAREHDIITAVIEDVHAMPRQGVTSSFGFGRSKGVVEGVIAGIPGIRTVLVRPQQWKKDMGLIKAPKDKSRSAATQAFGDSLRWPLKKHVDRAEAALMAAWWVKRSWDEI